MPTTLLIKLRQNFQIFDPEGWLDYYVFNFENAFGHVVLESELTWPWKLWITTLDFYYGHEILAWINIESTQRTFTEIDSGAYYKIFPNVVHDKKVNMISNARNLKNDDQYSNLNEASQSPG